MYNIISYDQLKVITGRSRTALDNKTKIKFNKRRGKMIKELKTVTPFAVPNIGVTGQIFIVLDYRCVNYIKLSLGI